MVLRLEIQIDKLPEKKCTWVLRLVLNCSYRECLPPLHNKVTKANSALKKSGNSINEAKRVLLALLEEQV